jgi:hypothetical protein
MKKINVNIENLIIDHQNKIPMDILIHKYGYCKQVLRRILVENVAFIEPYRKIIKRNEIEIILKEYETTPICIIAKNHNVSHTRIVNILKNNNIINHGNRKYSFDRRIFEKINDEKTAYWLGFLYADGCIYKSKDNKCNHVLIKLSIKDIIHLELFKSNFCLPHSIKIRKEKSFGGNFYSAQIRITSKEMVNDLIKHGCFPNKTFTLQFPDIDKNLIPHFMRGYFDGDGSISSTNNKRNKMEKHICILGNYDFINKYQQILMEKLNLSKTKIIKKENIYYLSRSGNDNVKLIGDYLYKDSNIYLERKKKHFDELKVKNIF